MTCENLWPDWIIRIKIRIKKKIIRFQLWAYEPFARWVPGSVLSVTRKLFLYGFLHFAIIGYIFQELIGSTAALVCVKFDSMGPKHVLHTQFNNFKFLLNVYSCKHRVNTLRPRQNGSNFADDIFKCIFWNKNYFIFNLISLKFVPRGPISNDPALVQIMAWRQQVTSHYLKQRWHQVLMHKCVTRPQWVKLCVWCMAGARPGVCEQFLEQLISVTPSWFL